MAGRNRGNDRYDDYDDFEEYEERQRMRRDYEQDYGDYGDYDDYGDYGDDDEYDDRYENYYAEEEDFGDDYDYIEEGEYEDRARRNVRSRSSRDSRRSDRYDSRRSDRYDSRRSGRYDDRYDSRRSGRSREDSRKEKQKRRRIILFIAELLVLAVVLAFLYFATRVNKVEKAELQAEKIEETISEEVKESVEVGEMKGYRNIALFGVDSTTGSLEKDTRSDSIIIASINEDTGEVKLVSIYRDTYLNLGNDSYNKCNTAYAKGGPEQAISMLNMNLDMNITDFVTVGFGGLKDVIDAVGGIDIDVDEAELQHINNYQLTMADNLKLNGYTEVTHTGLQHLNGLQATAYCRIRYTTGWDYMRAARQREVLMATIEKAKTCSPTTLISALDAIAPEIYTSLDITKDVPPMIMDLPKYYIHEEDVSQMGNGFPQQDMRTSGQISAALGDCVVPRTLSDNVIWLHHFLFEDEDYSVSQQVQNISNKIDADTSWMP